METSVTTVKVHTERTFAIARSSADTFERVIFEISEEGFRGRGEAAPTSHYGEDAKLETYVICARVRSATIPGGSGINWIVNPGGEELAGGLLREVLKAVEGNGDLS